jgi:hypothetical protein
LWSRGAAVGRVGGGGGGGGGGGAAVRGAAPGPPPPREREMEKGLEGEKKEVEEMKDVS